MEQLNEILNLFQSYIGQLKAIELLIEFSINPSAMDKHPAQELVEVFKPILLSSTYTLKEIIENEAFVNQELQRLNNFKIATDFIKIDDQWKYNFQNYLGTQKVEEVQHTEHHLRKRLHIHLFGKFNYLYAKEDGYTNYCFTNDAGAFTFKSEWFVNDIQFKRAILKVAIDDSFLPYLQKSSNDKEQIEKGFSFIVGANWERFKEIEKKALVGNATFTAAVRCASFCKRLYDDGFIVKAKACNEQINAFSKERYDLETFGALQAGKKLQREQHMNQTKNGFPPLKYAFE